MKKILFLIITIVALITGLYSCHGNGGSGTTATGTVAVYLADDMSNVFSEVTATIDRIQLISFGTGTTTCDVFTTPAALNIANLSDVMQLVNVADCPAQNFNRIRIRFDKNIQLMLSSRATGTLISGPTDTVVQCSFTQFKDAGSGNQPDVLECDPATNICSLDINGAVNVLARQNNRLALDFNLKDFDVVSFGTSSCAVTMKVSPLTPSQMNGRNEVVTGLISALSTTGKTFDLTRGSRTFSVLYSAVSPSVQPGLDFLLQRAQDDGLRTKVTSSAIDFENNTIAATSVAVKVEGTVSNLAAGQTFSVTYGQGGSKNLDVDYSGAKVDGVLEDGTWADVRLDGYSTATDVFLARHVEVESVGMMTED